MKAKQGFTLLEISIVLVIIALIAGGALVGQSLLQSARLREVIGEYDRNIKAIKEFQDKYQALPGDMTNAESMWGSDAGCPNTPTNTTPKVATCNGDGSGTIGSSTTAGVLSNQYEWFRAWQQLTNAGLINGQFTGVAGSAAAADAEIGVNVPKTALRQKSGWTLYYYLFPAGDISMWGDHYGHIFSLGADSAGITNSVALSPNDAKTIDDKMDDGKPGRGIVRTRRAAAEANCTDAAADALGQDSAIYSTSSTYASRVVCSLIFIGGF